MSGTLRVDATKTIDTKISSESRTTSYGKTVRRGGHCIAADTAGGRLLGYHLLITFHTVASTALSNWSAH